MGHQAVNRHNHRHGQIILKQHYDHKMPYAVCDDVWKKATATTTTTATNNSQQIGDFCFNFSSLEANTRKEPRRIESHETANYDQQSTLIRFRLLVINFV